MAVTASDLVWYASANMPEDDVSTSGGAIDTAVRVVPDSASLFNSLSVGVSAYSSNGADTMNLTIYGRTANGELTSETKALTGTSVITFSTSFTRLEKIVLASSAAGTVSVVLAPGTGTDPADTIVDIETGVTTIRRMFYDVAAEASGGTNRDRYEKVFLKNNHSTLSALSCQISESSDAQGVHQFALEDAVDDNESVSNRLTAPSGIAAAFSNTAKTIPGTDLGPGEAIGVWVKQTLNAGTAAAVTTLGLQADAQSVA